MADTSASSASSQPRLTLVVPVYNEERTLETIIQRILSACGSIATIVYVDDGSKDASLSILQRLKRPQDTVLTQKNAGKGAAVRVGFAHAKGVYTIVQDADVEYSPEEIPDMLRIAEENNYHAMYGSRRLKEQRQYVHIKYYIGGVLLTWLGNVLYGTHLTDQPNCYKLVRTSVLHTLPLKANDFRFDAEITALLARKGIEIHEFATSYHPRTTLEGKKIGWKDWFASVWVLLKLRVVPVRWRNANTHDTLEG